MARILCIETATTNCSVALFDGENLLAYAEQNDRAFSHSEKLHVFIDEVLQKAGLVPRNVEAVAVSKGPGSYTGLRIGVSAAKGWAYALGIPLVSVGTLELMARVAAEQTAAQWLVPMIDARRMEIYTAVYDRTMLEVEPVKAEIVNEESFSFLKASGETVCFFGDGMDKCRGLISAEDFTVLENIYPSACFMAEPALAALKAGRTEDVAYFEPYYLKDFVGTIPGK